MKSKSQITQKELKQAYQIVTADLFNKLIKAKNNETIQIGTLGSFKKTEGQMVSHMKGKSYGKAYVFNKIKFTMASKLKQALNQALEKKYNR